MSSADHPFDWSQLDSMDLRERIERLKKRAEELSGGGMLTFEDPAMPPDIQEQFWRQVVETEEKELFPQNQLRLPPVEMPDLSDCGDEEVSRILWGIITELGERRIYLAQTDHLSDRELYECLREAEIRELSTEVIGANGAWHFDILGGYGEEDIQLYLKYYADELTVEDWKAECPDMEIPSHEDPPYDRASRLPAPDRRM